MNNELRTEKQEQAILTLMNDKRLILEWGTGVGKTRVAVLSCAGILSKYPNARILLLVQETAHKNNWRDEFVKTLGQEQGEDFFSRLTVECYASLKNYNFSYWNLIIADEGHHLRGDNKIELIKTLAADRVLFLSATINDRGDGKKLLETLDSHFGPFTTLSYGINNAIDDGILAEPVIHVLPVKMNENYQKKYVKMTDYMDDCKDEYYKERSKYRFSSYDEENAQTQPFKNKWMMAACIRKRFTAAMKTAYAASIIKRLDAEKKKYICFCGNIKQIQKLGGEDYICSKKSSKENNETIAAFNEGRINRLFSVGMIREGQNLRGIEVGIIVQLDSKERSFKQMFGRVMRSDNPVLYMLYIPGSQDEKYLENALKDTDQQFIKGWTKPVLEMKENERQYNPPRFDWEISRQSIACQLLNTEFYKRNDVCFLSPRKGKLTGRLSDSPIVQDEINGIFRGIYYDTNSGYFNLLFENERNRSIVDIVIKWNNCYGLLMPLSNINGAIGKPICVTTKPDGDYTAFNCYLGTSQLKWPLKGSDLPKDEGGRINLINNLIYNICNR